MQRKQALMLLKRGLEDSVSAGNIFNCACHGGDGVDSASPLSNLSKVSRRGLLPILQCTMPKDRFLSLVGRSLCDRRAVIGHTRRAGVDERRCRTAWRVVRRRSTVQRTRVTHKKDCSERFTAAALRRMSAPVFQGVEAPSSGVKNSFIAALDFVVHNYYTGGNPDRGRGFRPLPEFPPMNKHSLLCEFDC